MKRRSRAGNEPIKGRRRKTARPKRRNAPKFAARSNSSPIAEPTDVVRFGPERDEAMEQLSAASEVLKVITSSPGNLKRVFETILENATRLCEAKFGALWLREGDVFRIGAGHLPSSADVAIYQPDMTFALHENPNVPIARMVETKTVFHVADLRTDQSYIERSARIVPLVEIVGARTFLGVPMLKNNELVGAFVIYRTEVRLFTEKQIALVQNFAAQAVIAIENARLLNELRQSLERQTATSDVLQVISSSPGDLEPVFMTMLEKAVHICGAKFGSLYLNESDRLRLVAGFDVEFLEARGDAVFEPAPGGLLDQVMRTKRPAQVADLAATKPYLERHPIAVEAVELGGIRTAVAVPMLKDHKLIGIITIVRQEVRPASPTSRSS